MQKRFLISLICAVSLLTVISLLTAFAESEQSPVTNSGNPVITANKIGSYDGFDYELWTQNSSDPVSMTLTGGGTFKCNWDAENVLFRTGKKLGSTKTYMEYGNISMEYAAEHTITRGDVNYLCMYGWTEDPLIEFYIIENHGNYKPPGGVGFQGTYELDGSTYEVYVDTRVEQPSIQGTKTFKQYFSVRTDKRTEGTISISEHFKEWDKMGLDMSGKMYEIALCVEGYKSSGNVKVSKHILKVGDSVYGSVSDNPITSNPSVAADSLAAASPATTNTPAVTHSSNSENPKSGVKAYIYIAIGFLILGVCSLVIFARKKARG